MRNIKLIDFNSRSALSDRINQLFDAAITSKPQEKRDYLGGSRIGVECERALQYEFYHTPKDDGKDFSGRILRVFDRGHWAEKYMIETFRNAGYDLRTEGPDGQQFGFSMLGGHVKGHCDGVFLSGPPTMIYPCLWECKALQEKDWKNLEKEKLRKKYPVYYAQIQIYQKQFGMTVNPALFTALNCNTMTPYHELIPHDPAYAAQLEAKAARIIQSCLAGELLPRAYQDPNYFMCKSFCSYSVRCWR